MTETSSGEDGRSDQDSRKVVNRDAFEALAELPDDFAHAAVIDYPWEFEIQNGTGRFEYRNSTRITSETAEGARELDHDNAMFEMESSERLEGLIDTLSRTVVDGGWLLFMADDQFMDDVRKMLKEAEDIVFRRNWCWTPEDIGMGYYGRVNHYPIPVATVGETDRYVSDRGTLFKIPGGRDTEYHTGKPIQLYRELLAPPVVREGERLLEPFCGSAPGAAVAAERDLKYWGCDIEDEAIDIARSRLQQTRLGGSADLDDFF